MQTNIVTSTEYLLAHEVHLCLPMSLAANRETKSESHHFPQNMVPHLSSPATRTICFSFWNHGDVLNTDWNFLEADMRGLIIFML